MCVAWTTVANLMNLHRDNKKTATTAWLRDKLQEQDFAKIISLRVSRILGLVCRFRIAQILPHMKLASRASRLGLLLVSCASSAMVLCTTQTSHVEGEAQMCRVGCPDEPDSLSHHNERPLLYNVFASFWRQATVPPRLDHPGFSTVPSIWNRGTGSH